MGNDSKNNENSTNDLHTVLLISIIILLCVILYYVAINPKTAEDPQNIGSLEHYDSIYSRETGNISTNQNGDITGYHTPDGLYYIFKTPIPADEF